MSTPLIDYARQGMQLTDVTVLDMHAHIGRFGNDAAPPFPDQVREQQRLGIDASVISSLEAIFGDVERGNDDVAAACAAFPGLVYGYCHVSAQYPALIMPELERCFADPVFKGIKVYQMGTPYSDPLYEPVWRFAAARRVPVLAHTWGTQLTGLDQVALAHPDVAFMAAHAGSGFAYNTYLDAARTAPNFYLDLSYSREHTNMIELFVSELGPERIVWGTDAPTFSMSHQLGKILFARIPDDAKRAIICGNASRLLGIDLPASLGGTTYPLTLAT